MGTGSQVGPLATLRFPTKRGAPGDPLAVYQTLDRWFGGCIPHDAMNEHGIVTWAWDGQDGDFLCGWMVATKNSYLVIVFLKQKAWKKMQDMKKKHL